VASYLHNIHNSELPILKYNDENSTPKAAIAQIRNKEYCEKLRREKVVHILAVGLSYDTVKKEHQCMIEEM